MQRMHVHILIIINYYLESIYLFFENHKRSFIERPPGRLNRTTDEMRAARFIGRLLFVQLLAYQLVALHTYDFCPNECGVESGYGVCEVRFLGDSRRGCFASNGLLDTLAMS